MSGLKPGGEGAREEEKYAELMEFTDQIMAALFDITAVERQYREEYDKLDLSLRKEGKTEKMGSLVSWEGLKLFFSQLLESRRARIERAKGKPATELESINATHVFVDVIRVMNRQSKVNKTLVDILYRAFEVKCGKKALRNVD